MSVRFRNLVSFIAIAIASPVTVGAALIIYESVAPAQRSLIVGIMERVGHGEGAQADASREAEALFQFRLAQAQEENKRVTAAYSRLYDALGHALQRTVDLESEVVKIQARNIDETLWSRKIGSNLADIGCMVSIIAPEAGLEPACDASASFRNDIVDEYRTTLAPARPALVEEMMRAFPAPSELLQPEFERARDEFSGTEGAR